MSGYIILALLAGLLFSLRQGAGQKPKIETAAKPHGLEVYSSITQITDSRDIAALLMVIIARQSGSGHVSKLERSAIALAMTEHMAVAPEQAGVSVEAMESLTVSVSAIAVLSQMTKRLKTALTGREADDLAHMLTEIAITDGAATDSQTRLIYKYRQQMGLNARV